MNNSDLAEKLAASQGLTKADARKLVDAVFAAIADAAVAALRGPIAVLDRALAKTGFLVGGRFTVADINAAEIVRYAQPAPELFEAAPHVKAWLTACQARPAFKKMWAERDKEPA